MSQPMLHQHLHAPSSQIPRPDASGIRERGAPAPQRRTHAAETQELQLRTTSLQMHSLTEVAEKMRECREECKE